MINCDQDLVLSGLVHLVLHVMLALARPLYLLTFSTVDADAEDELLKGDVFKLRESGLRVANEIEHTQSPVWR